MTSKMTTVFDDRVGWLRWWWLLRSTRLCTAVNCGPPRSVRSLRATMRRTRTINRVSSAYRHRSLQVSKNNYRRPRHCRAQASFISDVDHVTTIITDHVTRDDRCALISASRWRHDRHFRYICVALPSRLCKTVTFDVCFAPQPLMDYIGAEYLSRHLPFTLSADTNG